ncbi:MAG: hypothetical protein FWE59_07090 [Oscillospiraceae bacterium]|nr:hypothetical protein [Oscillospiraceae bacterium]
MKQNNISIASAKTKERLSDAWKSASKAKQDTILEMSGVARSTVCRAYRSGGISAKLAMAMAQVLGMDPFYFTGESDAPGALSDELTTLFLHTHQYGELFYEWNKSERRRRAADRSPPPPSSSSSPPSQLHGKREAGAMASGSSHAPGTPRTPGRPRVPETPSVSELTHAPETPRVSGSPPHADLRAVLDALTEGELATLMHALVIRARGDARSARSLRRLKELLLLT